MSGAGQERVIVARGPGDLIGEAGVEPGGVRSATVTAAGTVLALIIEPEDFAAIVSEHPGMPDMVKRHAYDRLTGRPDLT